MIIPVHMFAFADEGDRSKVRHVQIPISPGKQNPIASEAELSSVLEMVFKYGQNDFQPLNFPSVSVGDVAEIRGEYYMVTGQGWKKMTKEQFDNMPVPSTMYAYGIGIKDAAKGEDGEDG
jgi:hypothetical protein